MTSFRDFVAEITAVLRSRPLLTVAMLVFSAGPAALIGLSLARGEALAEQLESQLESTDARLIRVTAAPSDGVSPAIVDLASSLSGVELAFAFGPSFDVSNELIRNGPTVPARRLWTADRRNLHLPDPIAQPSSLVAWLDERSAVSLGINAFPAIALTKEDRRLSIIGLWEPTHALADEFEGIVVPSQLEEGLTATSIMVLARSSADVGPAVRVLRSALPRASTTVSLSYREDASRIVDGVGDEVKSFGKVTLMASIGASGTLIAVVQSLLVLLHRRDLGRRRALGAARLTVALIVIGPALSAAAVGAIVGGLAGGIGSVALTGVPPPVKPIAAVAVLLLVSSGLFAAIPAWFASHLDPAHQMRSP